ncbi:MAG: O-antigen ligase family protein [Ruminococcus sp.]|nr:O-antigen ligase family protein [Ruminococcus sp.]
MSGIKEKLMNPSKFRISYLIVLFFCNISFVQIPAYICLVFLFLWGVYLVYYKIRVDRCFDRFRFGIWILAFLAVNFITMLLNLSMGLLYNILMLMHISICFFIFYGIHTEKELNTKAELYKICKFIIYSTTLLGALGFAFMMSGVKFEWMWIKFIIYENRYTGVYINPNILGFISVVSIVCCHLVMKPDFLVQAKRTRISRIWIAVCLSVDLFSLLLCDSNASFALFVCYVIFTLIFIYFSSPARMKKRQFFIKSLAVLIAAAYVIATAFMVRSICQQGFSQLLSPKDIDQQAVAVINEITGEEAITFTHVNENIDSGRLKLIKESFKLFKMSPLLGISNGNIVEYSQKYLDGTLSLSYHNNDIHNGYLTIIVSTGIIGFVIFAIWGLRFGKHIVFNLFKRQNAGSQDILPCLFAFCCGYLVYSLFEKALLFDVSFMVIWFWYMLGMTSVYLNKYEPLVGAHYMLSKHRIPQHLI